MVDATALGAVVEIRVGSSPSISKFYIRKIARVDYWNGHVKPLWDEIFSIVGSNPTSSTIFFKEGSHNGIAAVLKTADRKVVSVRVTYLPPIFGMSYQ